MTPDSKKAMISALCEGLSEKNATGSREFFLGLLDQTSGREDRASLNSLALPIARRVMEVDGWQNWMTEQALVQFCELQGPHPDDSDSPQQAPVDEVAEWMVFAAQVFVSTHTTVVQ